MTRPLTRLLTALLDTTGSLGAGVVDGNGLLVQGCGLHGGQSAENVAALLGGGLDGAVQALLGDTLLESLLVGQRHRFYVCWVHPYLVYLMREDASRAGAARAELRRCSAELSDLLSSGAARQRLEQPRQFTSSRLVR